MWRMESAYQNQNMEGPKLGCLAESELTVTKLWGANFGFTDIKRYNLFEEDEC